MRGRYVVFIVPFAFNFVRTLLFVIGKFTQIRPQLFSMSITSIHSSRDRRIGPIQSFDSHLIDTKHCSSSYFSSFMKVLRIYNDEPHK
jgi:hypothetical protein